MSGRDRPTRQVAHFMQWFTVLTLSAHWPVEVQATQAGWHAAGPTQRGAPSRPQCLRRPLALVLSGVGAAGLALTVGDADIVIRPQLGGVPRRKFADAWRAV